MEITNVTIKGLDDLSRLEDIKLSCTIRATRYLFLQLMSASYCVGDSKRTAEKGLDVKDFACSDVDQRFNTSLYIDYIKRSGRYDCIPENYIEEREVSADYRTILNSYRTIHARNVREVARFKDWIVGLPCMADLIKDPSN